jgi:serine/threonine protein kinase
MAASPTKQGWGRKLGGFIKNWKRRWFILEGTTLRYLTEENGKERGRIDLSRAKSVARAPECRFQPAFKIEIPRVRTYLIVCDTESDATGWISAIQSAGVSGSSPPPAPGVPHKVCLDDFEILKLIGQGAYGSVKLVRCKLDGRLYAMKYLSTQLLQESDQLEQVMAERNVLTKSVHPFLVGAHYAFQTDAQVFLILDYVPGGELFARLREERKFDESRVRLYAAEILLGLGFLHQHGFVYRDLKPENILVDRDGHLRITDFGLVKGDMTSPDATTSTFCGTPEYMPPEILSGKPYTRVVDWWSYGTLVYEMLCGAPPFYDENANKMYKMVLNDRPKFPNFVSPVAQDFILRLLDKLPAQRLGGGPGDVEEIKEHPFFAGLDWEKLMKKEIEAPWKPKIDSDIDTRNFDAQFTQQSEAMPIHPAPMPGATLPQLQGFTFTDGGVL